MNANVFAITSSRILCPERQFTGHIIIEGSKIRKLIPRGTVLDTDIPNVDVGNLVVMPGIIDSHVHINEPGRTDWEGFETATKAAAAGGITTLVDMPLNSSPVTTNKKAFDDKLQAAQDNLYVNCGFWGGYIPGSLPDLEQLLSSGVLGIKVFLIDSGLDEFKPVTKQDLEAAMGLMKASELPLLAHAEMEAPLPYPNPLSQQPYSYQAYLKTRPDVWEYQAIKTLIELCTEFQSKVHVVHLSSASALEILSTAKKDLPITVETCPHYLYFTAESIPDGDPSFKCAPPIRSYKNNEKLWEALISGTIDFIATDHSPAVPSLKYLETGNLEKAWGGISSLQFLLPIIWTCCQERGQKLDFVRKFLSEHAAGFLGLDGSKGKIAPGYDADLVIWDPETSFTVHPEIIRFKHPITPYLGKTLYGVIHKTYVNGHLVFDTNQVNPEPKGEIIRSN